LFSGAGIIRSFGVSCQKVLQGSGCSSLAAVRRGCIKYRESLDRELPEAQKTVGVALGGLDRHIRVNTA
jgi:hypothetical protein